MSGLCVCWGMYANEVCGGGEVSLWGAEGVCARAQGCDECERSVCCVLLGGVSVRCWRVLVCGCTRVKGLCALGGLHV